MVLGLREFGAVCSLSPAQRPDFLPRRTGNIYESRIFAAGGGFGRGLRLRLFAKRFGLARRRDSLAGCYSLAAAVGRLQAAVWLNGLYG